MSEIRMHTQDLSVGYNKKTLIGGIALTLRQGEIMTLIGPNGAGKSTILKSLIRPPWESGTWPESSACS